jgi:DNA ligase-1
MKRFAELYLALDSTNRNRDKLQLIVDYLNQVSPDDAAWAIYFLLGNRLGRLVSGRVMRQAAAHVMDLPDWLVEASYAQVGDLAETVALLLPDRMSDAADTLPSLHRLVERLREGLTGAHESAAQALLKALWQSANNSECLVLNKLLTGGMRVGVSRATVIKALAQIADVEPAVMAHRIMGGFRPQVEIYLALFKEQTRSDASARPYPFYLANSIDEGCLIGESLGDLGEWQIEWKWDGIRTQLLRREGMTLLWSRGEELVGESFPEIIDAVEILPQGMVLDGEVVGWDADRQRPLPFAALQQRLGRKRVSKNLREAVPICFIAYDILENEGIDLREESMLKRRARLESIFAAAGHDPCLRLSPIVETDDWQALQKLRGESRVRGVEGFMIKRKAGPYRVGRVRGDWWKWKVDPFTLDAVLVNAVQGHGRRAGLYTDYTFALRDGALGWVPFAKAYTGLTDAEIRRVDAWIRQHTLERHGPVRIVKPNLVFEIAFEGIAESRRHKCGLAVRFPRIHRWREDKSVDEADDLQALRDLYQP